jgi:hypothetical protein
MRPLRLHSRQEIAAASCPHQAPAKASLQAKLTH